MGSQCRFCGNDLKYTFVDLGMSPLANSYVPLDKANVGEMFFPLHAYVCEKCHLVQIEEYESPEGIFSNYAYFSSYSKSWLEHCKAYVAHMCGDFGVGKGTHVVELASNDGYLLQYFQERGIETLGIEPAANVAKIAIEKGIDTEIAFFGAEYAKGLKARGISADLIVANNVLAHVPDINRFVEGTRILLSADGFITIEFPYLFNLIKYNQFDTIYHEHFSYLSMQSVRQIFRAHGLHVFYVEELPTHGGSLRIFACHQENSTLATPEREQAVSAMLDAEEKKGVCDLTLYQDFSQSVQKTKRDILVHLIKLKNEGKRIAAYGAPAKGNTLLNYCGIGKDFIDFTVDQNPVKQNTLLPGSHIPVFAPERIREEKPDYLIILPWNLKDEIIQQCAYIREWGGKFIVLIPQVCEL